MLRLLRSGQAEFGVKSRGTGTGREWMAWENERGDDAKEKVVKRDGLICFQF